jgi:hypothetical protein
MNLYRDDLNLERTTTFDLKSFSTRLKRLSDRAYRIAVEHSEAIQEDGMFMMMLERDAAAKGERLSLGEIRYVLDYLYGSTSPFFDDWKGSFAYPFRLEVVRGEEAFGYVLTIKDWRGNIEFLFRRELPVHERPDGVYHPPREEEFSRDDMQSFTAYLYGYLTGRLETLQELGKHPEPFLCQITSNNILYGYVNGRFVQHRFDDEEKFERVRQEWDAAM